MKWLKDEKGYTLVTVLLILAVVSVISVSLMTASYSSFKAAKSAETDTQDKLKAERVVDEVTAMIENDLETINTRISSSSMTSSELLTNLHNDLNSIASEKQSDCTLTYKTLQDGTNADGTNPNGSITVKVVIEVPVGNARKTLKKVMTLSTISDVFQYTVVTPGNLILYGAPYIEGDVNVGGDLYSSNYATYVFGLPETKKTSFPAINGNLTTRGKYYSFDTSLSECRAFTVGEIAKHFSVVPTVKTRQLIIDTIDVGKTIDDHTLSWPRDHFVNQKQSISGTYTYPGSVFLDSLTIKRNAKVTVEGDLYISGSLSCYGSLTVSGNIYVGGEATLSGTVTLLNSSKYIYLANNAELSALNLNGVMYINHSATLTDDVNTNGSIYARSSITAQNFSNHDGTLILLCDGNITISNNNEFEDDPKVMNAYFYSNSELFIYGVGSNIRINGGIYGNPIKLSATKGTTYERWWLLIHYLDFQDNQDSIDANKSRLSIYFKKNLVLNPPKGIPTVNKVSLTEIDTSYVDSH
ncbi:type II secretion system protein [Heyndrickxia acidiproducens]|uniref:type II secretion system protein n=1 Tax=Heyndrickxia acidiproducens TaxID=1121084 RepID=UPI00036B532A|nr:type II secretion system protein [Heyndrickxia acidiproducens]